MFTKMCSEGLNGQPTVEGCLDEKAVCSSPSNAAPERVLGFGGGVDLNVEPQFPGPSLHNVPQPGPCTCLTQS